MDYQQILVEHSILESERIRLRPFTLDDVEDVYLYAKDDQVTKYLTWETHQNITQSKRH